MEKRSPVMVLLLGIITLGIYGLYWVIKTRAELCDKGADIPTAWLIIIPLVNIWWLWKYSQGVEKVTAGKMSAAVAFILLFLLGVIGMAIIQDTFNRVE